MFHNRIKMNNLQNLTEIEAPASIGLLPLCVLSSDVESVKREVESVKREVESVMRDVESV